MAWRARRAKRARMESPRLGTLRAGMVARNRRKIIRKVARPASRVLAINRVTRKMEIKASAPPRRTANKDSKEITKPKTARPAIKSSNWPAIILKISKMVHRSNPDSVRASAKANAVSKGKIINRHKTANRVKMASKGKAVVSRHKTANRAINNRKAIRTANKLKAAKTADAPGRGTG